MTLIKSGKFGRPRSPEMEMSILRKAKHCKNCGEYKSHEDFTLQKSNPDGRHSHCRPCRGKMQYQYQLRKAVRLGQRIKECANCGDLFRPVTSQKTFCQECR
jgi:hypothetical protein